MHSFGLSLWRVQGSNQGEICSSLHYLDPRKQKYKHIAPVTKGKESGNESSLVLTSASPLRKLVFRWAKTTRATRKEEENQRRDHHQISRVVVTIFAKTQNLFTEPALFASSREE